MSDLSLRIEQIRGGTHGEYLENRTEVSLRLIRSYLHTDSIKGLKILDFACGGIEVGALDKRFRYAEPVYYPPAFCLACSDLGAEVTGIDISLAHEQDEDYYEHIRANLIDAVLKKRLHVIVGSDKFDVIHSSLFTGLNPSPMLEDLFKKEHIDMSEFEKLVREEVALVLKEGGIYVADESSSQMKSVWQKKEGLLVKVR